MRVESRNGAPMAKKKRGGAGGGGGDRGDALTLAPYRSGRLRFAPTRPGELAHAGSHAIAYANLRVIYFI